MAFGYWLGLVLVLAVVEMLTVDFIFIMLAIGALAGALVAYFLPLELIWQVVAFAVVSILLLISVRPWAKHILARSQPNIRTNVDALAGKPAHTIEAVTREDGRIRLDGEIWSARTSEGYPFIPPDTKVTVVAIDGATAIITLRQET